MDLGKLKSFLYSVSEDEKFYCIKFFGMVLKIKKVKIYTNFFIEQFNRFKDFMTLKKAKISEPQVKFSVIMPTYNRAFCVKDAISSLFKQTYKNFELIIIDDCSTDNTKEVIEKKYIKELKSGKIIYKKLEKKSGVCAARNEGLQLAQNEWIAYLDSDNKMSRYFLERVHTAILLHPQKCYYGKMLVNKAINVGKPFDFKALCEQNYIDLGVFIHHKSLYETLGGFDTNLKRFVDWDLIIRYTKNNEPYFIDYSLLEYTRNDNFVRISNTVPLEEAFNAVRNKIKNVYKIEI